MEVCRACSINVCSGEERSDFQTCSICFELFAYPLFEYGSRQSFLFEDEREMLGFVVVFGGDESGAGLAGNTKTVYMAVGLEGVSCSRWGIRGILF